MQEALPSPLEAWANFYIVVGSAAAGLTGLQFVVLTLIAQVAPVTRDKNALAAFGSPNVVHFCVALLVAAVLCAPWHTMLQAGIPVMLCGAGGVAYSAAVIRRAHRQSGYTPVFEDWLWHTMLPPAAYFSILMAGLELGSHPHGGLFVIAGAELLLVFIGIHNAWDTVTYVTLLESGRPTMAASSRSNPDRGPEKPVSKPEDSEVKS